MFKRTLSKAVASAALRTSVVVLCACGDGEQPSELGTPIGAVLPFTGEDATIGQNLEQAMLLAIEDVNAASGEGGRQFYLESRDSNSGSARGLNALLDLMYNEGVRYIVGPEENELANEVVPDVKGLDVFNVLAGFASPTADRVARRGAWLRLPPSALAFGCGLSELARQTGVKRANALVALDDFNQSVASEFVTEFVDAGGASLPSITVRSGASSYLSRTERALDAATDRTLLIVNPTTASTIITEAEVKGERGSWLFGPTLHTPGFLPNVPFKSLQGALVLSPTLSLESECEAREEDYRGPLVCGKRNADMFADYFAKRWYGNRPFPAAHFYYDGVVLVAMGLRYAEAHGNTEPTASELHDAVVEMTNTATRRGSWRDLPEIMARLADGIPVAYAGAAHEYDFDKFGAAKHLIFDSWRIERQKYVHEGSLQARCLRQPK